MGCTKELDFVVPPAPGAHLSFYWTMDEGGVLNKVDSTSGLVWPLVNSGDAGAGLFVNGTHCPQVSFLNQYPGLQMFSNASVVINQAVSKGIGVWFWIKVVAYGATSAQCRFTMDTSSVLHTNLFEVRLGIASAVLGASTVNHQNDTDTSSATSPNLTWALGAWHMVAITYDKTPPASLNLYIDGALSATTLDPWVYPDLTSTDMILNNAFAAPLQGNDIILDECGICLNGALTPTQITALYNGGIGVTWPGVQAIVPFP